jgi:hypothetical protein
MNRYILLVTLCALSACGGGGSSNGTSTQVATTIVVGALDGNWNCDTGLQTVGQIIAGTGNTLKIARDQYYPYIGATAQALTYNQGITTGPDTAHYAGAGNLAQRLVADRIYKVIHLAPKVGYAGIYMAQELPVGRGREFHLNGNGMLVVTDYSVQNISYNEVYSSASGGPADLVVKDTTCTKAP